MSSEWFDLTEPSLPSSVKVYAVLMHPLGVVEGLIGASRTTSLQRQQEVETVVYMNSEWFDCIKPSLTTYVEVLMHPLGVVEVY